MLLASGGNNHTHPVSLVEGTFDCSLNATPAI